MAEEQPANIPVLFDTFFRSLTSSIQRTVRETIQSEISKAGPVNDNEQYPVNDNEQLEEGQKREGPLFQAPDNKRPMIEPPAWQRPMAPDNKRPMIEPLPWQRPMVGYRASSVANFPMFENMHNRGVGDCFPPKELARSTWYDIPMDHQCWASASREVDMYFIIEDDESKIAHAMEVNRVGQLYGVVQLTSKKHYQVLLPDIRATVGSSFESCRLIRLYPNNRNHANKFLFIHNEGELLRSILDRIDFVEIKRRLDEKPNGTGTDRQPKKRNISYGYATVAYVPDRRGFNVPALLAGSTDSFAKKLFMIGSSIVKSTSIPEEFAYTPEIERLRYPGKIAEGNYFEGCTIFGTNRDSLLQPHCDSNNAPPQSKAAIVIGASRFLGIERLGVVFYNKKSIEDTIPSINAFEKICEDLVVTYNDLPVYRKFITWETKTSLTSAPEFHDIDGVHYSTPCNIDPVQYHQLFVDSFCRLASSVVFSMSGVMAFISCFELFPQTAYYLSVTTDHYLRTGAMGRFGASQFQTIHDVCTGMIMLRSHHRGTHERKEKIGIFRFAARNEPIASDVPPPENIRETAEARLNFALAVWKWHPVEPRDKKTAFEIYQQVVAFFSSTSRYGSGPLASQHAVAILAVLGVLPPWVRTIATIKGRLQSDLTKMFPKPTHLWQDGKYQRSTMATIGRYMEKKCGGCWSPAVVENYLCKYVRMQESSHSDKHFVDVHRVDEILLEYRTGNLLVATVGNKVSFSDSNGMLCQKWEFGEGEAPVTAKVIAEECFRDVSDDFKRMPPNKFIMLRVPLFQKNFMRRFPEEGRHNCLPREIYQTLTSGKSEGVVANL